MMATNSTSLLRNYYKLESESDNDDSDGTETVYSMQDKETEYVKDISDTETKSVATEYTLGDDDDLTYCSSESFLNIQSDSSSTDCDIIKTEKIIIDTRMCTSSLNNINELNDNSSLNDSSFSSSNESSNESEHGETDYKLTIRPIKYKYKQCVQCKSTNNYPEYRYCMKCFHLRKQAFEPRPKATKKRNRQNKKDGNKNSSIMNKNESMNLDSSSQNNGNQKINETLTSTLKRKCDFDDENNGMKTIKLQNNNYIKKEIVKSNNESDIDSGVATCSYNTNSPNDHSTDTVVKICDTNNVAKLNHSINVINDKKLSNNISKVDKMLVSDTDIFKPSSISESRNNTLLVDSIDNVSFTATQNSINSLPSSCNTINPIGSFGLSSQLNKFNIDSRKFPNIDLNKKMNFSNFDFKNEKFSFDECGGDNIVNSEKDSKLSTGSSLPSCSQNNYEYNKSKNCAIVNNRDEQNEDNDAMCIMCVKHPKNGAFIHSMEVHICTCYQCALKSWKRTKKCPLCNLRACNVKKVRLG